MILRRLLLQLAPILELMLALIATKVNELISAEETVMSICPYFSRLLMIVAVAFPLAVSAAPRYKVTVLTGPGGTATDINSSGQVVGQFRNRAGDLHAFLHSGTRLRDLGTLNGGSSFAAAINDHGQVVGYSDDGIASRAFRYALGTMHDIGTLGGEWAAGYGINASGQIVGGSATGDASQFGLPRAFVHAHGAMRNIGTLPNGDMSVAYAINNAGQIVGRSAISTDDPPEHPSHAFLYSNGRMIDLGTLGGLYSHGTAINDKGWVVGQASTDLDPDGIGHTIPHAFLYKNGMMIDLGALGGRFGASEAYDVNNQGQVVGWSDTATDVHAFLYEGGNLLDLNSLIDPASGWTLQEARGINDMQQIAATACRGGDCYAVRLDPANQLPEPGTLGVCLLGLGLLGIASTRASANRG